MCRYTLQAGTYLSALVPTDICFHWTMLHRDHLCPYQLPKIYRLRLANHTTGRSVWVP